MKKIITKNKMHNNTMSAFSNSIINKQLKELNETPLFQEDKDKYLRKPITEEILMDYNETSSWMRANIFINQNRIINQIGIGFILTGGGGNLFDLIYRDKSSRAIIFAQMPYLQQATYEEYKSEFIEAGIHLENDSFIRTPTSVIDVFTPHPVSAASENISGILANACYNKLSHILETQDTFKTYIAVSLSVDFGSENDKPARFFIVYKTSEITKTFGYLFSDKSSREKMNNIIVLNILNILANEINQTYYIYYTVNNDGFPKRTSELSKEENKKYYDTLYLLL